VDSHSAFWLLQTPSTESRFAAIPFSHATVATEWKNGNGTTEWWKRGITRKTGIQVKVFRTAAWWLVT